MRGAWTIVGLGLAVCLSAARPARAAEWTPARWADAPTLELRTDCPDEGEHWSTVWLAVVDGQLYVRLGKRATARVGCTRTAPYLGVRVGGAEFERVRMTPAPEMADAVAAAMHAKYWSDVFVAWVPHQLTLRLAPD